MKTLLKSIGLLLFIILASSPTFGDAFFHCSDPQFVSPRSNQIFIEGSDVYVRVDPRGYGGFQYVSLYLNGKFVRKESQYPFEWCKKSSSGDAILRNIKEGKYVLLARARDNCGNTKDIRTTFYVRPGFVPNVCRFNNPLYDLPWLKKIHSDKSLTIAEYRLRGDVYFKIYRFSQSGYVIYWYDCEGKLVCRNNGGQQVCSKLYGIKSYKNWWLPASESPTNCNAYGVFKFPFSSYKYKQGNDVYVKVQARTPSIVKQIDLYLNGRYVGSDKTEEYEWAKGNGSSHPLLRNMRRGSYTLKAVIRDICGTSKTITRSFRVY